MMLGYIIGEPGAGKTTLMNAIRAGLVGQLETKPFAHTIYGEGLIEIGRQRDAFSGTDALSMSVQPKVLDWMELLPLDSVVVGEGDRLSTNTFFHQAARTASVYIARVQVDKEEAARRRTQRASLLGTALQSEAWVTGRRTKIERIASQWILQEINGELPLETQVDTLCALPPFAHMRRLRDRVPSTQSHL